MTEAAQSDHSKRHPTHTAFSVQDEKDGSKARWREIRGTWSTKDGKGFVDHLVCIPKDFRIVLRETKRNA